jgi:hypothetical protein
MEHNGEMERSSFIVCYGKAAAKPGETVTNPTTAKTGETITQSTTAYATPTPTADASILCP